MFGAPSSEALRLAIADEAYREAKRAHRPNRRIRERYGRDMCKWPLAQNFRRMVRASDFWFSIEQAAEYRARLASREHPQFRRAQIRGHWFAIENARRVDAEWREAGGFLP